MHLRAGDHQPRRGAPQQQGQQALQQGLVGKVVHACLPPPTLLASSSGLWINELRLSHQRQEELESGSIGGIGVELDSAGK